MRNLATVLIGMAVLLAALSIVIVVPSPTPQPPVSYAPHP